MSHTHRWKYLYLPGDAYRYCECGEVNTVDPNGKTGPVKDSTRTMVLRKVQKTAAYPYPMTANASVLFGYEKNAFGFNDVRRATGAFLQRFRRAAPAAVHAAGPSTTAFAQHVPQAFRREVVDLSGVPARGTMFRPPSMPHTMQMRTPPPGAAHTPNVHVPPTHAAEHPTVYRAGGPPALQPTVQMSPQAFPAGHPNRAVPPPIPAHVRDASMARRMTPNAGYGGVRGSQRDFEVINGKREVSMGLGGMLAASPEGAFLHNDPRFKHLLDSNNIEELDALAHGLMGHQQSGGRLTPDAAMSYLRSPQYQQSLRHFKYSSLRGSRMAKHLFKQADVSLSDLTIPEHVLREGPGREWVVRARTDFERGASKAFNTVGAGSAGAIAGMGLGALLHRHAVIPGTVLGAGLGGYIGSKLRVPAADFFDPEGVYRRSPSYLR